MGKKIIVTYTHTGEEHPFRHREGDLSDRANYPYTFALRTDENVYNELLHYQGQGRIPDNQYEILKMAEDGTLNPPQTEELSEVFGTSDGLRVGRFIAEKGRVREGFAGAIN